MAGCVWRNRGPYRRVGSVHGNAEGYGRGIYFTAYALTGAEYSFHGPIGAAPALLISKVLLGKSHVMHGRKEAACQQRRGVDSHVSGGA